MNLLRNIWKRSLIIILCIALVAVRMIWPNMRVDATSLWLLGFAAFLLLMPDLRIFIPYIKRVKLWEAELELKEVVQELDKEVQKAKASANDMPQVKSLNNLSPDVENILQETTRNPRAALLLLGNKLDTHINQRFKESGLLKKSIKMPATSRSALKLLIEEGVYSPSVLKSYEEFTDLKNRVAHNLTFEVPESMILSIISLGTEILRVLSAHISPIAMAQT